MNKVLVIAKDQHICDVLRKELAIEGLWADLARTEVETRKLLSDSHYELIIRDSSYRGTLNTVDGTPILVLFDVASNLNLLDNFNWDTNHFLVKPFKRIEFKEKVYELLSNVREQLIVYKDLKIDVKNQRVTVKDKIISLGKKEKDILVLLVKKAGQIVHHHDESMLEHLQELKRKLKASAGEAVRITSFYGGGHMLEYKGL